MKGYLAIVVIAVSCWLALYIGGYEFIIKELIDFINYCINGTVTLSNVFLLILNFILGFISAIAITLIGFLTSYLILND